MTRPLKLESLKLASILGVLIAVLIPFSAQAKQRVDAGCRQGICWETFVLNKKLVRQDRLAGVASQLYKIELETKLKSGTNRSTNWVYCSTRQPFLAFSDSTDKDLLNLHYLNPGGDVFGYNTGSNKIYWAVCHDDWTAQVLSPEQGLAEKARRLGVCRA
jgi:hypothetical protein